MSSEELRAEVARLNVQLAELKQPTLWLEEAIGARLYTGPMYVKYNAVLRGWESAVRPLEAAVEWRLDAAARRALLCVAALDRRGGWHWHRDRPG